MGSARSPGRAGEGGDGMTWVGPGARGGPGKVGTG